MSFEVCQPWGLVLQCVNAVSRKCEYGVLEITSDTKVLLSHESQTSDLTKDFCFTRDFQNPILTFPHSQHWHCWKLQISDMKLQMKWDIFLKEMKFLSILVNVLTCDYIDFYKLAISQDKKTCETDAGQNQCTHMWLHWLLQISNFTRQKNLWNWCWSKVNVLTCEYIDFCLAHVTTLTVIYKMYKNCAITFNLHDKLFHRVATIVVFNNEFCFWF